MATTIRIPIDLTTPEQTGLAGNSFWRVTSGTTHQMGYWGFLGNTSGGSGTGLNVTGGIVYGRINIPPNVDSTPNASIILVLASSATAGGLSVWRVGSKNIATGISFDALAFTHESSLQWTAPTTAWARLDKSFALTVTPVADQILEVKVERDTDGTNGTDNTTATIGCFDAFLQIDVTA